MEHGWRCLEQVAFELPSELDDLARHLAEIADALFDLEEGSGIDPDRLRGLIP